ncbi:MAG: lytic transglycosylase domain-containing protein [Desulfitobacterium hafniense]|nr:lytic transglycosylase domain-containing protein [Desulfitobacterium hafniense]
MIKKVLNLKWLVLIIVLIGIGAQVIKLPAIQKIYYPYPYRPIVEKYSADYGVDPLLVISVIRTESKFLPKSKSNKGAQGLMQLMPNTARWISQSISDSSFTEEDLIDPEKNIQYGTWYLANLQKEFNNNATLVLAAYNGGSGRVKEWIKSEQINIRNIRYEDIPFRETREYVQRVLESYHKYVRLYRV